MKAGKTLIYLLLILPIFIIVYFWWQASGHLVFNSLSSQLIALGRIAGLLLVYFVLLQLILRSRITLLESVLGFMTLNTLHKKNGYLIFALLFLHPLFLLSGYTLAAQINIFFQIYLFLFTYEGVFKAFISFLLFNGVVFSSIYLVRKKLPYELWYLIHLTTYIAILFAWDHQLKVGGDFQANFRFVFFWYALYGVVFTNLIYWRIWKQTYLFYKHRFYITKIVKETHDTYSLYLGGKNINTLNFKPGQFAFLRILRQEMWWESHPFSFSQANNKKYIRFTIKALGDFTKRVKNIPLKTQVILDGPHGEFTIDKKRKSKLLFIAGGAGITPIRALLEKFGGKHTILLYSNKTRKDIIFRTELEKLSKKQGIMLHYVLSQDIAYKGRRGKITFSLIKRLVKDLDEREIYICGPASMTHELQRELKQIIPKSKIHTEIFSL